MACVGKRCAVMAPPSNMLPSIAKYIQKQGSAFSGGATEGEGAKQAPEARGRVAQKC